MTATEFNQELITKLSDGKSIKSILKRVPLEGLKKLQETLDQEVQRKEALKKEEDQKNKDKAEKIKKAKEELAKLGLSINDLN